MASEKKRNITWKEMKKQKVLIIWSLIIVVYGVIFCYLPLAGWMMAFQNYKPMQDSGGRRVMRAIYIDINTISFCTPQQIIRLKENGWIEDNDNAEASHTVNIELLRRYLERYLSVSPHVRTDMIYMVRQQPPTPQGLPLELYFFVNNTEWKHYEHIQSSIFNHVYAVVKEFGLLMYQAPSGTDLKSISQ